MTTFYRYVRLLGAFYMRLVGKPSDVYQYLEPLYNDYRKVRFRITNGSFTKKTLVLAEMAFQVIKQVTLMNLCKICSPRITVVI